MITEEKRAKANERARKWRKENPEKARGGYRRWAARNREYERQRSREKNRDTSEYHREWQRRPENVAKRRVFDRKKNNTPEGKAKTATYRRVRLSVPINRIRHLVRLARKRALTRSIAFDDRLFELATVPPTHCPCCNVAFNYVDPMKFGDGPSLDRIDSTRGYTLDNVAVICGRCNRLKSDASLSELKLLVAYVERELPHVK